MGGLVQAGYGMCLGGLILHSEGGWGESGVARIQSWCLNVCVDEIFGYPKEAPNKHCL